MKVCVLGLRGFPEVQGGAEKHCEELYTHFASDEVNFIIFRRKPYVKCTPKYENIRFIDLPSTRIKGVEPVLHSFFATVVSIFLRPDIVHIHNIGPALFCPLLRLFRRKVVVTYHSPNYEHSKWGISARMLLKFCEKLVLQCANKIIFVNSFQMGKIPEKYKMKLVYIPNGIADGLTPSQNTSCIEKLGLEKDKFIFALGRITPEKGFDILIDAFERADLKDFKLCIAGAVESESGYFNQLKKKAGGNVCFPGFVTGERLKQLYSHARLFVLPSRNEGFPLVLLDAMAYGKDIIASDIPASHLVDLPKDDYFQKENINQLSSLLKEKIESPPIYHHYNLSRFNWNGIVCETIKVYQDCYEC